MLRLTACILLGLITIGHAVAESRRSGDFDYYVLALSWSPSWCVIEGDARRDRQCREDTGYGFTLHGLWPQYERGWPSFCPTSERAPSRAMTAEMVDIMGSAGLAWHQWDKHGRCSGLSAADYYATARAAYDKIVRPDVFRRLLKSVDLPATLVEEAFVKANAGLAADAVTVTCKRGHFQEVRICLTPDLEFRSCGVDVQTDCDQRVAFPPVR
jgi:ribonuclease T2